MKQLTGAQLRTTDETDTYIHSACDALCCDTCETHHKA